VTWEIRQGDALERLREMPDESVQCCVTSPPYWGLRDYGVEGQLGLEERPAEFIAALAKVRRVLRSDGTLWLNIGDSYAGSWGAQSRGNMTGEAKSTLQGSTILSARQIEAHPKGQRQTGTIREEGLKPKDLVGIPWALAFALRADSWYLRRDIIWSKPNPMPESVQDRPTSSHEYLFLLSKSRRYFYDAEAIRETATWAGPHSPAKIPYGQGFAQRSAEQERERQDKQRGHSRRHAGFNDRWDSMSKEEQQALGRNKRSVWTIATRPYPEAHFATFPPDLVEPCVLAGSKEGDTVLDPFSGAATTGLVATRLERDFIGIELNPEYVELGRHRIQDDAPLLNTPAEAAA